MKETYEKLRIRIEEYLEGCFRENVSQGQLLAAMRYSLLAGGKRIRPVLTLAFCRASGGDVDACMPVAAAVEMLHTYTLIHDDLPCMDNDSLRRGKPTNHIVYGADTATLAGDALQAEAFRAVLSAAVGDGPARRAALALAEAAGALGVCGGQVLDLAAEGCALEADEIMEIDRLKTGALIAAACRMGVIAGGGAQEQVEAAQTFGENLGLAFQIRDDVLDVEGDAALLGKSVGSDRASGKATLLQLLGRDRCMTLIDELTAAALESVERAFADIEFLSWICDWLIRRTF